MISNTLNFMINLSDDEQEEQIIITGDILSLLDLKTAIDNAIKTNYGICSYVSSDDIGCEIIVKKAETEEDFDN